MCLGIKLAVKVKSADNDKNDVAPEISFEKLRDLAMKTKEERNGEILKILSEGAVEQFKYTYDTIDFDNLMIKDQEKGFFEI